MVKIASLFIMWENRSSEASDCQHPELDEPLSVRNVVTNLGRGDGVD